MAQIQPKSQFLFHDNLPLRDFSIMTLTRTDLSTIWQYFAFINRLFRFGMTSSEFQYFLIVHILKHYSCVTRGHREVHLLNHSKNHDQKSHRKTHLVFCFRIVRMFCEKKNVPVTKKLFCKFNAEG